MFNNCGGRITQGCYNSRKKLKIRWIKRKPWGEDEVIQITHKLGPMVFDAAVQRRHSLGSQT